jgi:two-component system sensor histidine kinase BaeS
VDGQSVLVEARPTNAGAIVLVQRRADAVAVGDAALRRLIVALAIAVGIAVLLGLIVAWRLARPLKRTAAAAHALNSGRRDVVIPPEGPVEVREVSDALNRLAAGLAQSEARQRQFLMSVSHDLRTPLTAINGYAESLADGVVTPDQTARVGAIMLSESHRLSRLVGDLLDLARLDAQEFRVDLAVIDVGGVIDSAADVWSGRCAAEGVRFVVERPVGPLIAWADASRLRQVLDGLLENALRVTPSGSLIVLAGRVEQPAASPHIVVEVRDGGPGLTDDDLAIAFDRSALYERYRGVRSVGTGLGLAIVHGLVERIGGMIEAGHAAEGGARFTVRLPLGGW